MSDEIREKWRTAVIGTDSLALVDALSDLDHKLASLERRVEEQQKQADDRAAALAEWVASVEKWRQATTAAVAALEAEVGEIEGAHDRVTRRHGALLAEHETKLAAPSSQAQGGEQREGSKRTCTACAAYKLPRSKGGCTPEYDHLARGEGCDGYEPQPEKTCLTCADYQTSGCRYADNPVGGTIPCAFYRDKPSPSPAAPQEGETVRCSRCKVALQGDEVDRGICHDCMEERAIGQGGIHRPHQTPPQAGDETVIVGEPEPGESHEAFYARTHPAPPPQASEEAEKFAHDVFDAIQTGAKSSKPTGEYMNDAIALVLARDSRIAAEARAGAIEECAHVAEGGVACEAHDGIAAAIRALAATTESGA